MRPMRITLHHGNVLDARADALVLTVDGDARALEGNVARQLRKRWGDDAWEAVEGGLAFPIALGGAAWVEAGEWLPFRVVFAAAVLDHRGRVDAAGMFTVVRDAATRVCERARALGLGRVASPLLKGGWRLDASRAFRAMVEAADAVRDHDGALEIHSLEAEHHEYLTGLARSFGLGRDGG